MSANGIAQIVFYLVVLTALTPPLGAYMARVFEGRRIPGLSRVLGPVERGTYRVLRIDAAKEQGWKAYAGAVLAFSVASFALLYAILRLQGHLPLNPADLPGMTWFTAFNTAASFVTNTNWQYYGGESTLSYLSQMFGLTVQNFASAAVGMAVLAAVIRGFARRGPGALGNFWADLVRITLYILLPLAIVIGLVIGSQGVVQTFDDPVTYQTLEARTLGATDDAGAASHPDDHPRARRVADRHQAARHQRRRLLQLQLGGPLREPDAAHQLPRDAGDPADPCGAHLHLRGHGGLARAGLGALRGDDDRAGGGDRHRGRLRAARWRGPPADRRRADGVRGLHRRQHERQGAALRHRQLGALGHRDHRRPRTARSTAGTTRGPAGRRWYRSP